MCLEKYIYIHGGDSSVSDMYVSYANVFLTSA